MYIRNLTFLLLLFVVLSQDGPMGIQQIFINANMSPVVHLILIYDSAAPNAQQIVQVMKNIAQKREGYFRLNMIDCNTDDEKIKEELVYCSDQHRPNLPALMYSKPSLNLKDEDTGKVNEAEMVPYQGGLDEKSLFSFAVPLMPAYSEQIRNLKDLKKFEEKYEKAVRIIYYTDKQKLSPFYRALTANFRNTIAFAHVFSSTPLAKEKDIKKYPIMELNGQQPIQIQSSLTEMISELEQVKGQFIPIYIREYTQSKIGQLTEQSLEENVYKKAQHILIHVSGADGQVHPEWVKCQKKFKKMFKFYQTQTLKEKLGVRATPAIVYFPKSLAKKDVQKTIFSAHRSLDEIQSQIDEMVDDFTVAISSEIELQKMTGIPLQQGKYVAVLFHQKQIDLTYKVLSNDKDFKEDIVFFRMRNPSRTVMQQFQIKNIPSLIIMMIDPDSQAQQPTEEQKKAGRVGMNLKLASYTGKFNYDDLSSYFRTIARPKVEPEQYQQASEGEVKNVKQIKKSSKFKAKCKDETCFLLLVNGASENSQKNKAYIQELQRQSAKIPAQNFAYIDGICHSEVRGAFEIMQDQLPALVYVNSKFEKYARLVGRLQSKSIVNLFNKVRSNKAMYRGYDRLQLQTKDCESEHEKMKKLTEQSSTLSQQEAQILEQLRAQEEKKRQQFEKAAKEDKVRRKKKRRRPKAEDEDL